MRGWLDWNGTRDWPPVRGVAEIRRRNGRTELIADTHALKVPGDKRQGRVLDWSHRRPGSKAAQRDIVAYISLDARHRPEYNLATGGGWLPWDCEAPAASEGPPGITPDTLVEIILIGPGLVRGQFRAGRLRWWGKHHGFDHVGNTDIVAWRPAGPVSALRPRGEPDQPQ